MQNRACKDHCEQNKFSAQQALDEAINRGAKEGEFSHVHNDIIFDKKLTFEDGSEMFFGQDTYTIDIQ